MFHVSLAQLKTVNLPLLDITIRYYLFMLGWWVKRSVRWVSGVTVPRVKMKAGSWKLELLVNISEGRKTLPQQEFVSLHMIILAFLQRCLGYGSQGF